MTRHLPFSFAIALFVLGAAGCATGADTIEETAPAERATESTDESQLDGLSDEERGELEEKFCRAALDHMEQAGRENVPDDCERVVMRRSEQFDEGDAKGYLVTVVVGERRESMDLGGVVESGGKVRLEQLESNLERAAIGEAKSRLRSLENVINTYYVDRDPNRLPESLDDLTEGSDPLLDEVPEDPWGNEYVYEVEGNGEGAEDFDLYSAGPDGEPGTADDVRSR